MVVRGIVDSIPYKECSTFEEGGKRIAIVAVKSTQNPALPLEWRQEFLNGQRFGNLPMYDEMKEDVVLGTVDLVFHDFPFKNIWTRDMEHPWSVFNARIFDTAVPVDTFKTLSDEEVNDLPVHFFTDAKVPYCNGDNELVMPVHRRMMGAAMRGRTLVFDLTEDLAKVLFMPMTMSIKPFWMLTLTCGHTARHFVFQASIEEVKMRDGTPIRFASVLTCSGKENRNLLRLKCDRPIFF